MSQQLRLSVEQYNALQDKKKKPKYGNTKKLVNGLEFDSAREARRFQDLQAMQHCGQISSLRRQVPFDCMVNGLLVCRWIADFTYSRGGVQCVEDSKGFKTELYRLKKKLVQACLGITIIET